ncbi:hypothetical protein [Dickeya fangzhongdai]|uniref:hypothetical protein n=1 Tax=Dickeya fangzhongdai TaxID=1778540 RepID=UPI0023E3C2E9|nr:hypothetical protein [Dickeya fangzhongdai]WES88776.1 hypothetical protein PQ617_21650 [Dickeya fangzhongdai]
MKIDKKLNLVSNITRDDGSIVYLHVTPFPYEVVEEHCLLLGNLFTQFISQVGGLGSVRVAAMMLRKKLQQERAAGNAAGPSIVDEIQRLTAVIYNENGQWKSVPYDSALKQGVITPDEYREVEGEVVFFIVSSAIQKRDLIAPTVGAVIGMFGGQLTVLSVTEFRDSLPKSNQDTDTTILDARLETSYIPS